MLFQRLGLTGMTQYRHLKPTKLTRPGHGGGERPHYHRRGPRRLPASGRLPCPGAPQAAPPRRGPPPGKPAAARQ